MRYRCVLIHWCMCKYMYVFVFVFVLYSADGMFECTMGVYIFVHV